MNTLMKSVLLASGLSLATVAQANVGIDQEVCNYIKEDNKSQLNKTLKSKRLSVDSVYKFTECEGMDIFAYANKMNATETLEYLNKKASKRLKRTM
ncbi:DUF3718 domain-containing protein [Thalassotalea mangrovi]|uniref:DUF3718 domain-containing protein n=1 Tax=Thalassotalea mangrovi TaxID=2572245 RepID=A0A4U1B687_9GAMM|nr:DUF3718 domain-containing protein [Thalassotalea mangrovi]TKB46041.1 DUF3718 domain-containing protein [Thalassotalea mangrovi]